jgi:APA family basic amino acid/polyamine antiporter
LNVLGLVGCLTLAAALPVGSVVAGVVMFAVGLLGRWVVLRQRPQRG